MGEYTHIFCYTESESSDLRMVQIEESQINTIRDCVQVYGSIPRNWVEALAMSNDAVPVQKYLIARIELRGPERQGG